MQAGLQRGCHCWCVHRDSTSADAAAEPGAGANVLPFLQAAGLRRASRVHPPPPVSPGSFLFFCQWCLRIAAALPPSLNSSLTHPCAA